MTGGDENRERASRFAQYFRDEIARIGSLENTLHRKILYVTLLDTLRRAAFAPTDPQRKEGYRFAAFVDKFAGWTDAQRVSALMLKLLLEKKGSTSGDLYRRVENWVDGWGSPNSDAELEPTKDPWSSDLSDLAATKDEREALGNCRYAELLYTYRNYLVHEFREAGTEFDSERRSPYYCGIQELPHNSSWEFAFPVGLFHDLCLRANENLLNHLQSQNRDPYDSYEFGTLWDRRRR